MLKRLMKEAVSWIEGIVTALPFNRTGNYLRCIYWSRKFRIPDGNITIFPGVRFLCADAITIGEGVSINYNVLIDSSNGSISIGNDVLVGPNCVFRAADHVFSDTTIPINRQGHIGGKIIIENDCWLSANVVILKDVTIGAGSVIGAGAVVTKNIPPYSIAGGIPARVIGHRRKKTPLEKI